MSELPLTCPRCTNGTNVLVGVGDSGVICCRVCSEELKQVKVFGKAPAFSLGASEKERTVVWENPKTGQIRYPGRNDAPLPKRYAQQGFERKELPTLRSIEHFEKAHRVRSEVAWYDKGSGRGAEND